MTKTNTFKKLLTAVSLCLIALLVISSINLCAPVKLYAQTTNAEITVFSWEDYLDRGYDSALDASDVLRDRFSDAELTSDLLELFETKTGIKVNYYSFATNEEMYNELVKRPSAVDLICPSEYMIMKLKEEELIKPFEMPQNYVQYGSEYIKQVFEDLGLSDGTQTYAVGYMWGTMGLIYNADKYSDSDFSSWSNLFNEQFNKKFTIKDSLRDSYIIGIAIVYEQELLEIKNQLSNGDINETQYKESLLDIFNKVDEETVNKVGETLIELKSHLYGFEVDAGKNDLLTGKIDVNFAWSGDAVYSIKEAKDLKNLGYVIPEEGSNVWFDGFVMTKNADTENALKFLDFICSPEVAVRNMEYIGYTSCIKGDFIFDYVKDSFNEPNGNVSVDLSYFFGNDKDYIVNVSNALDGNYMALYAQYADRESILRCAVMNNFSQEDLLLVNEMWKKVKLITLSNLTILFIVLSIAIVIGLLIVYKYREKLFVRFFNKLDNKPKKYKIIDKKQIK